eukprot:gene21796-50509_t
MGADGECTDLWGEIPHLRMIANFEELHAALPWIAMLVNCVPDGEKGVLQFGLPGEGGHLALLGQHPDLSSLSLLQEALHDEVRSVFHNLALLGCSDEYSSLAMLQHAGRAATPRWRAGHIADGGVSCTAAGGVRLPGLTGPASVALLQREQELRRREDALAEREQGGIFTQFGGADDRLNFEEFSILMLQRAKIYGEM